MLEGLSEKILRDIEDALDRAVPSEPAYMYQPIKEFLKTGGKRLRAYIPCLIRKELTGDYKEVLPHSITIELFHNFTLIHDDIEDGSELRRGKAALHKRYGIPVALNAGDCLYTLVFERAMDSPFAKEMVKTFMEVVEGQALELWTEFHKNRLTEDEVMRIAEKKTGALLGLSFYAGAWDYPFAKDLKRSGRLIGTAFQLIDDYLNIEGDERYGKEIGGDIREGKVSLIIVRTAMENPAIYDYLGTDKVEEALRIIKQTDALGYVKEKAERMTEEALGLIPDELRETRVLAERLLGRKK